MKIYAIEVNNLSQGMICGEAIPHGTLCIQVDRLEKSIYEKHGSYFISTNNGIVTFFQHKPNSSGGFADRPITLSVKGQGTVFKNKGVRKIIFKGTLWDAGHHVVEAILGYRLYNIGIRTGIQGCYMSCCVTQEWIDKIGQIVVLGEPKYRIPNPLEVV